MAAKTGTSAIPAGRLRLLRQRIGKTQQEIAVTAGIDPFHYARIERGVSGGTLATLVAVADALGVSVGEILARDNEVGTERTRRLANCIATLPDEAQEAVERLITVLFEAYQREKP